MYILIFISFSCKHVHAENIESLITGTWVTISHQTITVTNYKDDNTFAGTYFTPAFDVKATFSGKWQLDQENNILFLNYEVSSSPVMRVPFLDRNKIEKTDNNTLIFHTYPQGISVECKRIIFKSRAEVYKNHQNQKSVTASHSTSDIPSIYTDNAEDNRLIHGVLTNNVQIIKDSLQKGANVNIHEKINGNTPLILAAFYDHVEILKLLINSGANIHARCNEKNTALIKAAWNGSTESLKVLLEFNADVNAKEIAGMNSLMIASFWGHLGIIKLLVESGSVINEKNDEHMAALSYAKEQGHTEIIQYLLKNGAE